MVPDFKQGLIAFVKDYFLYVIAIVVGLFIALGIFVYIRSHISKPIPPEVYKRPENSITLSADRNYILCIYAQKDCMYKYLGAVSELVISKCGEIDKCEK